MDNLNTEEVKRLLQQAFLPKEEVLHGWIVTTNLGLFVATGNRFIFPTRQKAVAAFYNSECWRSYWEYCDKYHRDSNRSYLNWPNRAVFWKKYKEIAIKEFDFKVIEI